MMPSMKEQNLVVEGKKGKEPTLFASERLTEV